MRRSRGLAVALCVAVAVGSCHLLGCAAETPVAGSTDVRAVLEDADDAYGDKDYERAAELYRGVLAEGQELTSSQFLRADSRLRRIETILYQRNLAEQVRAAQAQLMGAVQPQEAVVVTIGAPGEERQLELSDALRDADKAARRKQYEEASAIYRQILASGAALTPQQSAQIQARLARVDSASYQRAMAEQVAQTQRALVLAIRPAEQRGAEVAAEAEQPAPAAEVTAPEAAVAAGEAAAAVPEVPVVTIARVDDSLAEAEALCAGARYAEAVPLLLALEVIRSEMDGQQKVRYDAMRQNAEAAGASLPALTESQKSDRAQEDYDSGIDAYHDDDYLTASKDLAVAAGFNVGIGWYDNRRLRSVRATVDAELARLNQAYDDGRAAYAAGDLATAGEQLTVVDSSPVSLGDEVSRDVKDMLADVRRTRLEQGQQELADRAGKIEGLLKAAADAVAAGRYEQAVKPLEDLRAVTPDMTENQTAKAGLLRERVALAIGRMPGATEDEVGQFARAHFDAGMQAYSDGDLLRAHEELALVVALGADLGRRNNAKVEETLRVTSERLGELGDAYKGGKDAYEAGRLDDALELLQQVRDSGVNLGDEVAADVTRMIADIQAQTARREAERLAQEQAAPALPAEEAAPAAQAAAEQARAEQLRREAEQVERVTSVVTGRLAQADAAMQAGVFDVAESALNEARQMLQEAEALEEPARAALLQNVARKMNEVAQARSEAARRAAAEAQAEAAAVVEEESAAMPAAEAIAAPAAAEAAAAPQVELTLPLSLVRDQAPVLYQMAADYMAAGDFAKAQQVLALVAEADPTAVPGTVRREAQAARNEAEAKAAEQEQTVGQLLATLQDVRSLAAAGRAREALELRNDVQARAGEAGLGEGALLALARADKQVLDTDLAAGVSAAAPDEVQTATRLYDEAILETAQRLAQFYLDSGAPELAEAHLRQLAASGDGWAQAALAGLDQAKTQAEQARLSDVEAQTAAVQSASQRVQKATADGDATASQAAARDLAAAQATLGVTQAEAALIRGDLQAARTLLNGVSTADLKGDAAGRYAELSDVLKRAAVTAGHVLAATRALGEHDAQGALQALAAARAGEPMPAPLAIRIAVLASALDAMREQQAEAMALAAAFDRVQAEAANAVAAAEAREAAWAQYRAGLAALFAGQTDQAVEDLRAAMLVEGGLSAAENANAHGIVSALAGEEAASESGAAALARAERLCAAREYAQAATALAQVEAMPAFAANPDVQSRIEQLRETIGSAERAAKELYDRAVAARDAADAAEVRRALTELKSLYSGTAFYQERQ